MAKIIIKRRDDPIFIENDRAKKLKERWLDDQTPRNNRLDLGSWAGTFDEIKSIELDGEDKYSTCQHEFKEIARTSAFSVNQCLKCHKVERKQL